LARVYLKEEAHQQRPAREGKQSMSLPMFFDLAKSKIQLRFGATAS
jgi:hypothetical protein